jgi:hypothetical protein
MKSGYGVPNWVAQGPFKRIKTGEEDCRGQEAEHDRQGEPHQQQPLGNPNIALDEAEIRVGSIRRQ